MKKLKSTLPTTLILVALLAFTLPSMSLADNPNEDCPPGYVLVAKFDWDDATQQYIFDKPAGNENVVTISGDNQSGTWTSTLYIVYWIIKGSLDNVWYPHIYNSAPDPALSGSFSKYHFPTGPNGQYPDISNIQFCGDPTAVTLVSFSAVARTANVTLAWETGTEIDNAGFNLYRAKSAAGPWTKINGALIVAQGDPVSGASYSFLDRPGYGTFYYRLEDVDYYGATSSHGPVTARLASPYRRPLRRPFPPRR